MQSENNKSQYLMRVCNRLLIKLRLNGINPTEAAVFFGQQASAMLDCKPNFGPSSNKSKLHELKKEIWLMRGFYPGTPQMFKISISAHDQSLYTYYVKVSEPVIRVPSKKNDRKLDITPRNESSFMSNQINDQLSRRLENEVLGMENSVDALISAKVVFTPKAISPKGMTIYKFDPKKD